MCKAAHIVFSKMNLFLSLAGILILLGAYSESINLDPISFFFVSSSDMRNTKSENKPTFFGFSSSFYVDNSKTWLMVGAPKANASVSAPGTVEPGAVYKCLLSDGAPRKDLCSELQMDYDGRDTELNDNGESYTMYKSDQWFGVSMDASDTSGKQFVACGHRRKNTIDTDYSNCGGSGKRCYRVTGACLALSNLHDNVTTAVHRKPSLNEITTNTSFGKIHVMTYAMSGISVHMTMEGDVVMGAPGTYNWRGAVIIHPRNKTTCVMEKWDESGTGANYIGYSVTSFRLRTNNKTVIASGAPRQNDTGLVHIFKNDYTECWNWHIFQTISSEQPWSYGSYFGASILAADVDGDGFEELFVGAPFQNLSRGDEGAVYCYTANPISSTGQLIFSKQLIGSNQAGSRFGTSISSAGDVNLDGFNDVIVGAPYEDNGSGAVYLFLGSSAGITTPFSQRIAASIVAPQLKSFGHSISTGRDFDGNGYPDIAVGAFRSDSVVVVRPRPVHSVSARIWFPSSIIKWQQAKCSSSEGIQRFEIDLIVSFFYSIPPQEERNIKNTYIMRNRLNWSAAPDASKNSKESIVFENSNNNSIQFLIVPCLSGGTRCVHFKVAGRPSIYLRFANNNVYLDNINAESDVNSFLRQASFRCNGTFAQDAPLTIESIGQPSNYLRFEDGKPLTTVNWNGGAFPSDAVFTFTAGGRYLPCIKGLTYDLHNADPRLRGFLVNRENNRANLIRETVDFTVENIHQPLNVSWTVAFEKYPRDITTPMRFWLNISGPAIGESIPQAPPSDRLWITEQSPMLNYQSDRNFSAEIGFYKECGTDDICTAQLSVNMSTAKHNSLIIGADLTLVFRIDNAGELAHSVLLVLAHPSILQYDSLTLQDKCNKITTSILDAKDVSSQGFDNETNAVNFDVEYQIPVNGSLTFSASFDTKAIRNESDYPHDSVEFNTRIGTERKTTEDSTRSFQIPIRYEALLDPYGVFDGPQELVYSENEEIRTKHLYDISNKGPGLMPFVVVDVLVPNNVGCNVSLNVVHKSLSTERRLTGSLLPDTQPFVRTESAAIDRHSTISCEHQPCLKTRFDVGSLYVGDSVKIVINIKISTASLPKNMSQAGFTYTSFVQVRPNKFSADVRQVREGRLNISTETVKVSTKLQLTVPPQPFPIWLVIIFILIAILHLVGLILILKKCGFFKRDQYEQLKEHRQHHNENIYQPSLADDSDDEPKRDADDSQYDNDSRDLNKSHSLSRYSANASTYDDGSKMSVSMAVNELQAKHPNIDFTAD